MILVVCLLLTINLSFSQGTRLLRQPTISSTHVAYAYGGDIWATDMTSMKTVRLTSTAAVESNPHFSGDGKWVAFSSNRSGINAVYIVSVEGGPAKRLTWYPSPSIVRGWTSDGKSILYSTSRGNSPSGFDRLWTVSSEGGPSTLQTKQWGTDGSFSPDGNLIVIDRVKRWDVEWRHYRGGQNTALDILNLKDQTEKLLPNESTFDIQPLWLGDAIYYLSDRDWTSNIWKYKPESGELTQVTNFEGPDIKWLDGYGNKLVFERGGYLFLFDLATNQIKQLDITIKADFPWAETNWVDVTRTIRSVSISPTGKRIILEARGDIFTVPAENGDARNMTTSPGSADHNPIWSPKGTEVAWFSDAGMKGYSLLIAPQDGLSNTRSIPIGESKMAWEPTWSPDGKYIAFVDNKVRVRIVDISASTIKTVDTGGVNIERGNMGLIWSHDSKWLAYTKTGTNNFRQIKVWSAGENTTHTLTNFFADSFSPAWDIDGHHLYFLATTNLALGSGWANTSSIGSDPSYAAYIINLRKEDLSPFKPKSDEETVAAEKKQVPDAKTKSNARTTGNKEVKDTTGIKTKEPVKVEIDFKDIERRTISIPMLKGNFQIALSGPSGSVFLGEQKPGVNGLVVQKFNLEKQEVKDYISEASQLSISSDGKKMLAKINNDWKIMNTESPNGNDGIPVKINVRVKLSRTEEWKQIFEEAWRYERDYFYDPEMHGRNWDEVYAQYSVLVPYVRHRDDLNYILDLVNSELSVGHSFVFGGDFPEVEKQSVGLLGADMVADNKHWKITHIYTTESWNPELSSPLDRPGLKISEGDYLVGINGREITTDDDPYQFLDGTLDVQTVIHINKTPDFKGSWKEIVKPIASEFNLMQRAWVEENRRMVDSLSGGKLAYVWVPNTGSGGFVSFNRYFFAQQDKKGAVIDERFNGGGLLDDYMVDLMNRKLRAALTNEVPSGRPFRLPAGILGPKVLLINELSGSGGDFFPWVFRQQKTGPLIGTRTWGGLVKSSVHYQLIDGGALTAPDNAVFDPVNKKWIAENEGISPDIEVHQDAASLTMGIDPQLECAVKEALKLLEKSGETEITPPAFPTPAKRVTGEK